VAQRYAIFFLLYGAWGDAASKKLFTISPTEAPQS